MQFSVTGLLRIKCQNVIHVAVHMRPHQIRKWDLWPLETNAWFSHFFFFVAKFRVPCTSHFRMQYNKLRITFHLLNFSVVACEQQRQSYKRGLSFAHPPEWRWVLRGTPKTRRQGLSLRIQASLWVRYVYHQRRNMFLNKKFNFAVLNSECVLCTVNFDCCVDSLMRICVSLSAALLLLVQTHRRLAMNFIRRG